MRRTNGLKEATRERRHLTKFQDGEPQFKQVGPANSHFEKRRRGEFDIDREVDPRRESKRIIELRGWEDEKSPMSRARRVRREESSPERRQGAASTRRCEPHRRRKDSTSDDTSVSPRRKEPETRQSCSGLDAKDREGACSCSCRYCAKANDVERRLRKLYRAQDVELKRSERNSKPKRRKDRCKEISESECESDASGLEANKRGAVGDRYGKYGIIGESHRFTKRAEFQAWIVEVKKLDYEELSQMSLKSLWSEFVEDHNTATFPSKKYYDMSLWDAKHSARQHDAGGSRTVNFDDEETRRRETRQIREKEKERLMGEAYNVLRNDAEIVEAMKRQKELKTRMDYLFKTGKVDQAREIQSLLRAEDTRNREKLPSVEIASLEED